MQPGQKSLSALIVAAEAAALFIKIKADKGSLLDEDRELLTFLSPGVIVGTNLFEKKGLLTQLHANWDLIASALVL